MSGYIGVVPLPQATQTRDVFTATSGQTSFATSGYTPSFLDVWLNGVKLVNGDDFTATNGSDVVLTSGATAGDTVEVLSYSTFEVNSQTFTGTTTFTGDVAFGDNNKAIFGDGSDLQIYHNGSASYISDQGTGSLRIGAQDFQVMNPAFTEYMIYGSPDGALNLYYDSSKKLATTSTGVDVTGTVTPSGGVYLGGTGSANLLDDVEFGTFTPALERSSTQPSVNYTGRSGYYTKVGDTVFVSLQMGVSSWSGGSGGAFRVGGLPFAVQSGGGAYYSQATSVDHSYINLSSGYTTFGGYFSSGGSSIYMIGAGSGLTSSTSAVTPQTTFSVYYSGHYRTAS